MKKFISGCLCFFYIVVVSQLWQCRESKFFFVFITIHLLLNQLHVGLGLAKIKCITNYPLPEYECQSVELRKCLDYVDSIFSMYRILNA